LLCKFEYPPEKNVNIITAGLINGGLFLFIQSMKYFIALEEAALALSGIYLLTIYNMGLPVWVWVPLFLSPDVAMLGYLVNTRVGALTYNLFHHRAVALIIVAYGYYTHNSYCISIGILLFAHSSFDRMLGYGLKYADSFKHTHLGWLPEKNNG